MTVRLTERLPPTSQVEVLGVPCFVGDLEQAVSVVLARAESRSGGYACFANAHVLASAREGSLLRRSLEDAWNVFPDGWPVAWVQRRKIGSGQRVAGPDVMPRVVDRGRTLGLRHVLFGSSAEVLERVQKNLSWQSPGAHIVDAYAPPFGSFDDIVAIERIRSSRPHVVWVALGAPKQEIWMHRCASELAPALVIGVGAAFGFLAGTQQRAPLWMQQRGLEWLHRLGSEPRRLAGRYVRTNGAFVVAALRELVRGA